LQKKENKHVLSMIRKLSTKEILEENLAHYPPKGMQKIKIFLHNIRSMHNVGSVFRSSDAFGVSEIILSGYTPAPPRDEITKTAIGAEAFVHWRFVEHPVSEIQLLKQKGYIIYGLEQTNSSISILDHTFSANEKVCIVMGNEVTGIDTEILPHLDHCLAIPQFGHKHSLNVSVATGVTLYALLQKFYEFEI
jgi:tRNA G18 (ribose-2'-O)-methylase SpoU